MFLAQTCVVLGAVRGGHLCHLGLQLLEACRSILPRWVCQEEVEKVRWIRNSKVEVTQQENVSHLSNCCCLPACWAWSSGETSDWNLNTQRTIVERVFVYSNKAVALLTAGNVTGRNKHPWTDSQLLWSQTVARLAGHNTRLTHSTPPFPPQDRQPHILKTSKQSLGPFFSSPFLLIYPHLPPNTVLIFMKYNVMKPLQRKVNNVVVKQCELYTPCRGVCVFVFLYLWAIICMCASTCPLCSRTCSVP